MDRILTCMGLNRYSADGITYTEKDIEVFPAKIVILDLILNEKDGLTRQSELEQHKGYDGIVVYPQNLKRGAFNNSKEVMVAPYMFKKPELKQG